MLPDNIPVSPTEAIVSIAQATDQHVKAGVDYWRSLCADRPFPARADLALRGMAAFLPYTVIVGVIDGGADYEYRFVGDAQTRAFKMPFKGVRVGQIEAAVPQLGAMLRAAYDSARSTAIPFIVRGSMPFEAPDSEPRYHETAFLPLGESAVDHLLIIGVQVPKPFWDIPEHKYGVLVEQLKSPAATPRA
jgi:hypothetical protein